MLGTEGKDCDVLTFKGPIEKIEASVTQIYPGFLALNSVRYSRTYQKTYGTFLKPFSSAWEFKENSSEVIGLYGMTNPLEDNAIVQLGFVTVNSECQAQFESLEAAEKGIRPEDAPPQIVEEESNMMLIYAAGGAAIIVIAVIVIVVVVCKR